jgi:extradiol dioxygenase family protein
MFSAHYSLFLRLDYDQAMSEANLRPFHIAFPVDDLEAARKFYGGVLGCPEGRSSDQWIDFNLFGHQIVAHYKPGVDLAAQTARPSNPVDGHEVPIPHFGVVLTQAQWKALAERVKQAGVPFLIEPYTRFEGQVGEQSTMFFLDPAGNALEFKAFSDLTQLFAK